MNNKTLNTKKEMIFSVFRLVRFEYSLFSGISVFLSGLLAGDLFGFQSEYLIAFLIVFISAIGSFAINDYYDYKVDTENNRTDRPLVQGLLPIKLPVIIGIWAFCFVILLSVFLNFLVMIIVLLNLPLFYLYSIKLKKIFLVKNILISYAYFVVLFLGSLISDAILEPLIIYFAIMGFIVGFAFEVMLDIRDVKGDKIWGNATIAAKFGVKNAVKLTVVLYVIIMVLDILPFAVMIDPRLYLDYIFLFLICIPVISYFFTLISLMKDQSKRQIFRLKKRIIVIMQIGSIAYLIGVLL